jgi:CRP-like cAMP-binding protein
LGGLEPHTVGRAGAVSADVLSADLMSHPAGRELVGQGMIFDVPKDLMVTRQGFCEREVYWVLEGSFEIHGEGGTRRSLGPWQVFGEEALVDATGRRRSSVRATTAGRLLVLPSKAIARWHRRHRRHPEIAAVANSGWAPSPSPSAPPSPSPPPSALQRLQVTPS